MRTKLYKLPHNEYIARLREIQAGASANTWERAYSLARYVFTLDGESSCGDFIRCFEQALEDYYIEQKKEALVNRQGEKLCGI